MRQIWITKYGPPEVLTIGQAPDPEPKPGELRIRVEASGVNFADIVGRVGLYPDLPPIPVVPGYEVSGHIDAAGTAVDAGWIGRDVLAMTRFGGYADVVCVPPNQVYARPSGISTTVPRISKRVRGKSPMATASNSFSMRSAATRSERDIACSHRLGGSVCLASRRQ
jgi:D-arabinose 1-dehydrogenase-like Zn-dependent alcohol dehydrogenase